METRSRMVPKTICTTETRTRTVNRTRMETQQRSREVCYTVCVPQQRTRTYNVTVYDCVTEQVPENYTVCVPVQSMKEVQVQVCRQVPVEIQVPVCGAGGFERRDQRRWCRLLRLSVASN